MHAVASVSAVLATCDVLQYAHVRLRKADPSHFPAPAVAQRLKTAALTGYS